MKRPAGITLLCLFLGWLTLAGVGNAYFILTNQFAGLPTYLGFFAAVYAITAFVACVGLWRMKRSGLYGLRAWMIVCLSMLIAMIPSFSGVALGGIVGIFIFSLFVAVLFWLVHRYVVSHLQMVA
jgi:hypothetical protein